MFKAVSLLVLAAVQLGSFCGGVAAQSSSEKLEHRDTSSFFASQDALLKAVTVFAATGYSGAYPPNVPELEGIAFRIKDCRDGYDAAIIQLASIVPVTLGGKRLTVSDAAKLNTTYIQATQQLILANLDSLQDGKAFFESVNNNDLLLTMFCHYVGDLSRQSSIFMSSLALAAPSADYALYWNSLQGKYAAQYHIWLTEDGFNCGGNS